MSVPVADDAGASDLSDGRQVVANCDGDGDGNGDGTCDLYGVRRYG